MAQSDLAITDYVRGRRSVVMIGTEKSSATTTAWNYQGVADGTAHGSSPCLSNDRADIQLSRLSHWHSATLPRQHGVEGMEFA
jgi:hypothetical protein